METKETFYNDLRIIGNQRNINKLYENQRKSRNINRQYEIPWKSKKH